MNTSSQPPRKPRNNRGVALVTTLLLLSLFSIMTLGMVIATMSDTLIDGYYRNLRGSFYAADSGVNAARQYMINQFTTNISASYVPYSGPPISTGTEATILAGVTNSTTGFGSYQAIAGSQTASWPAKFEIDPANTSLSAPTCVATYHVNGTGSNLSTVPTCTAAGSNGYTADSYTYTYPYKITAIGQSRANEQNNVVETGNLIITVVLSSSSSVATSFANWGTLFDKYAICSSPFVAGTMTGPFFSNDSWNFGDTGLVGSTKYIFTNAVGAASSQVGYMYSDGTCDKSASASNSHKSTTINPTFQQGLKLSQPAVPLPTDAYNQERAVLDGLGGCGAAGSGTTCTAPTQAQMGAVLKKAGGTAWPSSGSQPSSGVYVPYVLNGQSLPQGGTCAQSHGCFVGGGIMVQGNADNVVMTAANGSGNPAPSLQIFTITQGSTVTTVTLDLTHSTTTVSDSSGNSSGAISGLPENYNGGTGSEAAMLFVNGNISGSSGGNTTGLSGPSSGAAIQNSSAVTVTATGTIAITGSITYTTEPVTLNTSDTLIAGVTNVLGIFTPTGDIQLQPRTSNQNMEIDASLAMISQSGSGGLIASWNQINTLTIVGGRIANQAKQGNMNSRNIWYDQRFAQGGFAPPWFPSTIVTTTGATTATVTATPNRVSWANTTVD